MKFPELHPRQPLLGVALASVTGIAVADATRASEPESIAVAFALLVFVVVYPRRWNCWLFAAVTFFALHTLTHYGSDGRMLAKEFGDRRQVVHATGVVWSAPEKPGEWSKEITALFRLKLDSISVDDRVVHPRAIVTVRWAGEMPAYGDRVELSATAQNLAPPRNPGQIDFTGYLQRQGIFSELKARFRADCKIIDHGHGARAQLFALAAQRWIRTRLELDLADSPDIAALIESMVLGMHGETPGDAKEMFQRTGTLHLFAVSGLNVAMLATIVWFLLKPLGVGRKLAVFLIVPILCAYALVTGLSASCVRATIMGSILLVAFLFDRPPVVYNSLAAAAIGILAVDTNQLFVPGFQFSFVLVFTIVGLSSRIQRWFEKFGQPDAFLPRPLWGVAERLQSSLVGMLAGALGVTLSAWIGSLAFTAGYFHLFSPAAILANLIAVPLAFAVLALAVAALLVSTVWTNGALWFNNANWLCAKALLGVVRLFATMPGGHVYVELPRRGSDPDCEFTVFDLPGGGAVHLRAAGHDWLLDCGHSATYPQVILPYLRSRGVNSLDGLLLTHGDVRHVGAAVSVVEDFAPRQIVDSPLKDRSSTRRAVSALLAARCIGKGLCERGDVLTVRPDVRLRVLFPPAGLARSAADDKALVVRLECGGARVLFTSDSGFFTEQWLVKNEPDLRADLLVKGQHARDISGTPDFLARVHPRAVICSGPRFGAAPSILDEWTRFADSQGIAVFRQDDCGAARVEFRHGAWAVRGLAGGHTFNSLAR